MWYGVEGVSCLVGCYAVRGVIWYWGLMFQMVQEEKGYDCVCAMGLWCLVYMLV